MLIKRIQISLWDIIISGLLAIMFTVSPMFINTGRCSFTVREAGMAAFYFTLFIAGAALIRLFLIKFQYKFIFFEPILNHKHALIILTGIMFLLWLTILIILYPGTVINDTWGQLSQFVYTFYSDNKIHLEYLGDHHPVLTTFIMGQIIIPLANMVSNLQVAMFIYVILQAILTCVAFSCTLLYMHRKLKINSGLTFIALLIYASVPIFPGSVQTISKDSLNAWVFVFFTISFQRIGCHAP